MTSEKLAVFDWNGTILADSHVTWRAAARCVTLAGGRDMDRALYSRTITFPLRDMYLANGCDETRLRETLEEQRALFMEEYERHTRTCRTRPGLRALLKWLDETGVRRMILSNHVEHNIRFHLDRLDLDRHFHHISAHAPEHGNLMYNTSKRERLKTYLEAHGFAPENVVLFGDSVEEPQIAHALGATCISVAGGDFSTPRLRAANPHHLVNRISDAIPILERRWR